MAFSIDLLKITMEQVNSRLGLGARPTRPTAGGLGVNHLGYQQTKNILHYHYYCNPKHIFPVSWNAVKGLFDTKKQVWAELFHNYSSQHLGSNQTSSKCRWAASWQRLWCHLPCDRRDNGTLFLAFVWVLRTLKDWASVVCPPDLAQFKMAPWEMCHPQQALWRLPCHTYPFTNKLFVYLA